MPCSPILALESTDHVQVLPWTDDAGGEVLGRGEDGICPQLTPVWENGARISSSQLVQLMAGRV